MRRLISLALLATLLGGCAAGPDGPVVIPVSADETYDTPVRADVTCTTCRKPFPVRMMRVGASTTQDIRIPPDEPGADGLFDAGTLCPYCNEHVELQIQTESAGP